MPAPADPLRLMATLQDALGLADRLGFRLVGCHIDQALATLERQYALTRSTIPATTESVT